MDPLMIALRIVHVGAGVSWVGGAALFSFYIRMAHGLNEDL